MNALLEIALINAIAATALAFLAAVASRFVRRPAVVHALWVLVLLKLLTPPVAEIATLPRPGETQASPVAQTPLLAGAVTTDLVRRQPGVDTPRNPYGIAIVATWVLGGGFILTLALARARRFRQLVKTRTEAPRPVRGRAESLARRIGVRCPPLRLVDGCVPPMLWSRIGRSEILLPRDLLGRLSPAERDALIAHELAHLRRRDHWVRWLELSVLALFWWHPLVWWVRTQMRAAEERSCDALVLRTIPERSRDYARGLLKTVEFLVGPRPVISGMATGAGEKRHLKERLTMILKADPPARLTTLQRWGFLALCAGALAVFPTWADPPEPSAEERQRIENLERRAVELERQLRAVRVELSELQGEREVSRFERDLEEQRRDAARLAEERVARLAQELELRERELELHERDLEEQRQDGGRLAGEEAAELQRELKLLREHQYDNERRLELELEERLWQLEEEGRTDSALAAELERLQRLREEAEARRAAIDAQAAEIDAELRRVEELRRIEERNRSDVESD